MSETRTSADCVNGITGGAALAAVQAFTPLGAPTSILFGNGLLETTNYNNRSQVTGRTASVAGVNRIALQFYYCGSQLAVCAANNGNLQSEGMGYPANGSEAAFSALQTFGYDNVNRLTSVNEGTASQSYDYRQAGNRWVSGNSGFPGLNPLTPTLEGSFDATNNRLMGIGYDVAGNQTQLNPFTLSYDAENRMVGAVSTVNGSGSYGYDADGRRVKRVANGVASVYVYDGGGALAAEYGGAAAGSGTQYLTGDHLGSTRVVTDGVGNVVKRYDYLPFGEGLGAGVNGRSALYSVGAYPGTGDGYSVKFTGKERDAETGLDYFGARYYSGAQGRFTSPDTYGVDQHPEDPQSWNLYSYVRNNPLRFVDPTGEYLCGSSLSEAECDNFQASLDKSQANANKLKESFGADSKKYAEAQRAIDAYGARGVANGVTIRTADIDHAGEVRVQGAVKATGMNPLGQKVDVVFAKGSLDGTANRGLVEVHEGSHLADASDWFRANRSAAANPTLYQTEFRAYMVETSLAAVAGTSLSLSNGAPFSRPNWCCGMQELSINGLLLNSPLYRLTPQSKIKAFQLNTGGK